MKFHEIASLVSIGSTLAAFVSSVILGREIDYLAIWPLHKT